MKVVWESGRAFATTPALRGKCDERRRFTLVLASAFPIVRSQADSHEQRNWLAGKKRPKHRGSEMSLSWDDGEHGIGAQRLGLSVRGDALRQLGHDTGQRSSSPSSHVHC